MKEPGFSRNTIADIRDWKDDGKLEIQPAFQRLAVWNQAARVMLIDSILKKIPLPKIFIGVIIKNGRVHRIVIDGQQRITAILDFVNNKFSLDPPYIGTLNGKHFKDLDEDTQNEILSYSLDFNEFQNYTDAEIRDVYQRVNKYTFALTKQELRRADFPGDFLDLSEKLSTIDYFDDARIFTAANRRRLGDVEYISELLAALINGIQDKKGTLDNFYMDFGSWNSSDKENCESRFLKIIQDIQIIFKEDEYSIKKTRFKQKSDFYSLFSAINELHVEERNLDNELIKFLTNDLDFLDKCIEPGGPGQLGEYAVRCVSDANSQGSRKWRTDFIKQFLYGAYKPTVEASEERLIFMRHFIGIYDDAMCPGVEDTCILCDLEVNEDEADSEWCFPRTSIFVNEALLVHKACLDTKVHDLVF